MSSRIGMSAGPIPRGEEHLQEWSAVLMRLAESMQGFAQEARDYAKACRDKN